MAVKDQTVTSNYALYNGDCVEAMKELPSVCVDFSVYSPPFCGLYTYSSDPRDMSNAIDKDEFFIHYGYCVSEIARLTKPGRISAVHCMDIPLSNAGCDAMYDLPGKIIALHEKHGFVYGGRRTIWKEPLMVRNRTMMKSLHHKTLCEDSTRCSIANADYLLMFRRKGENTTPVIHETGLHRYAGENHMPENLKLMKGMKGDQKLNQFSQWIWRQYASSVWMDIRIDNVLDSSESRDEEDERHVHPLQLDVIERACVLWSNPGEVVLTPFMGIGSEVYGAIVNGRRGIGIELKPSYYRQAVKNCAAAANALEQSEIPLIAGV
jgi:DNA modification methylase